MPSTTKDPVMSSRIWSERLDIPLPDPLTWPLYQLLTEKEFRKRVGTTNNE